MYNPTAQTPPAYVLFSGNRTKVFPAQIADTLSSAGYLVNPLMTPRFPGLGRAAAVVLVDPPAYLLSWATLATTKANVKLILVLSPSTAPVQYSFSF